MPKNTKLRAYIVSYVMNNDQITFHYTLQKAKGLWLKENGAFDGDRDMRGTMIGLTHSRRAKEYDRLLEGSEPYCSGIEIPGTSSFDNEKEFYERIMPNA